MIPAVRTTAHAVLAALTTFVVSARGQQKPAIIGHWVSPSCEVRPGDGDRKLYLKRDFQATEQRSSIDLTFYADSTCMQPNSKVHVEGPYLLTQPSKQVEGAQDVTRTGCATLGFSLQSCPAEYDLVRIDRDELRFGARPVDGGGPCSPGRRAHSLQVPLKKIT